MLDPYDQAKLDQVSAQARETLPFIWHELYAGCMERGFTEQQSLSLVMAWLTASTLRPSE